MYPYTNQQDFSSALNMSHATHRKQSLLSVAAFAVCVFARICLSVSKLPRDNSAQSRMAHFNAQTCTIKMVQIANLDILRKVPYNGT